MKMTLCAPCLLGVEGLVADELRQMGAEDVRPENGRVLFGGDNAMLARANIRLRCAERVMILLGAFHAESFEELFQGVKGLPLEDFIGKDDEFPVTGSSLNSKLHSIPDCQAIIKKAAVERLKSRYGIGWFVETGPLHRIRFRILKDEVSILLDTSGEGLHKRGYRKQSTEAPIKETLAAAMAKICRVRSDGSFIDPLCGSGTILIEAAMQALNIAPGAKRSFVAETWQGMPKALWKTERELAIAGERRDVSFQGTGCDIDPDAVALTVQNAKKAGVFSHVRAEVRDIARFDTSAQYGCVICNPPYGERLLDIKQAQALYRVMGRVFVQKRGWSYGVISPDETFEKMFGRRADKRRKLYNGMIRCQFYQFYK